MAFRKSQPHFQCVTVDLRGHGDSGLYMGSTGVAMSDSHAVGHCAEDILHLTNHPQLAIPLRGLHAVPDLLVGHSFGGKVALKYVEQLHLLGGGESLPHHTWILDSLPGLYDRADLSTSGDFQSVFKVFHVLDQLPAQFESREQVVNLMCDVHGVEKSVALWLATNIVYEESTKAFRWSFNLPVIKQLFADFCEQDMWSFLETFDGDGMIHFLRAGTLS